MITKKSLAIIMTAVTVGLLSMLGLSLVYAQEDDPSASRSFDTASVAPDAAGGGDDHGLPATGRPEASRRRCRRVHIRFQQPRRRRSQVTVTGQRGQIHSVQGETSFTYTVTASSTVGSHTFSGTLRDFERDDYTVGGDTTVTVEVDATEPEPEPTPGDEQGQDPSASRSFSPASVAAGGRVVVTITADNYGQAGGVTETLPAGFTYVSSSLDAGTGHETGREVRFTLQGDASFTYTVTASSVAGSHTFSGTLRDFDRDDTPVGGDSSVTVRASSSGSAAHASRSFDNPSVAQGGEVVVTIEVANYGQAGGVTETLPAGFTYVSSSLDAEQVDDTRARRSGSPCKGILHSRTQLPPQ